MDRHRRRARTRAARRRHHHPPHLPRRRGRMRATTREQCYDHRGQQRNSDGVRTGGDRQIVTDSRTGRPYELPIEHGTIRTATARWPTRSYTERCPPRHSSTGGPTGSPTARSCKRTWGASCRASARTRSRWGCCSRRSAPSRPSTRGERDQGSRRPLRPGDSAEREDADARRFDVSPGTRDAIRSPGQRPVLRRQLPLHDSAGT